MAEKKQSKLVNFFKPSNEKPAEVSKTIDQTECKKKYELKRKRCFQESWTKDFPGLANTDKGMVCNLCVAHRDIADSGSSFVEGSKSFRIESIRSHFSSPKHQLCVEADHVAQRRAANLCAGPMDRMLQKIGEDNKTLLKYLFNTVFWVLQEELPFAKFPSLLKLQVKNGSELSRLLSYKSDKACAR